MNFMNTQKLNKDMSSKLCNIDCLEVVKYLKNNGIFFDRKIRINALKFILDTYDFDINKFNYFDGEILSYNMNEHMLEVIFNLISNKEMFESYKIELWNNILDDYYSSKQDVFDELLKIKENTEYQFLEYNRVFDEVLFDDYLEIDGVNHKELLTYFEEYYSNDLIVDFARKYDIRIPNRLEKKQFIKLLLEELKQNNKYFIGIEKRINKRSIRSLKRYSNKYNLFFELSKKDMIKYISDELLKVGTMNKKKRVIKIKTIDSFNKKYFFG